MTDVHYFSNGHEGRWWEANWCDRCLHDHQFRLGKGSGCRIFAGMLMGEFRPELIHNDEDGIPPQWWTCIEFKPYGYRKPGPPVPKPVPPGQGLLPFPNPGPLPDPQSPGWERRAGQKAGTPLPPSVRARHNP